MAPLTWWAISFQVAPPSRLMLTSIGTSPRLWVHRIVSAEPSVALRLMFGDVTVIDGGTSVNGTSLRSPSSGWPAGLTRTIACAVGVVGMMIVPLPMPALGACTFRTAVAHVTPPSVLTSTSNSCVVGYV